MGASGRGKTSLIVDRLINRVWRGLLDKIYVISSTAHYDKAYDRIGGNVTRLSTYTPNLIPAIRRREAKLGNNRRVLLYFDDVGGQGISITLQPNDPFVNLTTISRHIGTKVDPSLGWVVVFAAQCLSMVPTVYRKNCDQVIMFLEDNPEERRWLWRTYGFCNENNFASFMDDNLTKKHDFLFLDKSGGFPSWWKNLTLPLAPQVAAIKQSERMKRKRTKSQALPEKTTTNEPNKRTRYSNL